MWEFYPRSSIIRVTQSIRSTLGINSPVLWTRPCYRIFSWSQQLPAGICCPTRPYPILAKIDLENPRPVCSKSMVIIPGFPSGKFIQPSPFPLAVSYIMSKGIWLWGAGPNKKMKTENPPEERFMFLQKMRVTSPDSAGPLAIRSVFCSNRFIIKTHYLSRSMLYVEGAPETHEIRKRR